MKMENPIRAWVYHAEWVTLMATVIGCFIFCFRESQRTNDRLDAHNTAINARCDDLHKEFYLLLKEKKGG